MLPNNSLPALSLRTENMIAPVSQCTSSLVRSGRSRPASTQASTALAQALQKAGHPNEGVPWLAEACELLREHFREGHPNLTATEEELARLLILLGREREAAQWGLTPAAMDRAVKRAFEAAGAPLPQGVQRAGAD